MRRLIISIVLSATTIGCMAGSRLPELGSEPSVPRSVDFISEQFVPMEDSTTSAFRVDIEYKERPEPKARHTLSPIALDERGRVPPQFALLPTSAIGMVVLPRAPGAKFTEFREGEICTTFSIVVRVYRPGFRTIEVRPGDKSKKLEWSRADFSAQEKAIDDLLGVPRTGTWWAYLAVAPLAELYGSHAHPPDFLGDSGLQPGTVAAAHRDVLLFAAGEYARLASSATSEADRGQLKQKAAQIRRYADELTTEEYYSQQREAISPRNP